MTFSNSDILLINGGRYLSADIVLSSFPTDFKCFKSKKPKLLVSTHYLESCTPDQDYLFASSVKNSWIKSTLDNKKSKLFLSVAWLENNISDFWKSFSNPETQPEIQPETQPKTQPETQPKTQPETQPKTQPETQPKTQPETQPEFQPNNINSNFSESFCEFYQIHEKICLQNIELSELRIHDLEKQIQLQKVILNDQRRMLSIFQKGKIPRIHETPIDYNDPMSPSGSSIPYGFEDYEEE